MSAVSIFRNNWKPFKEVARFQADFEKWIDDMMASNLAQEAVSDFCPSCQIDETAKEYTLKFDMPGVPPENIKIELDQDTLSVSADRKEEKKSDGKKTRYSELSYGSYVRTLKMPAAVDGSKADAKYENGLLTVTLPKAAVSEPKKISVKH